VILIPKNWASFQHYKDRNPPWIKLHKGLLDDRAYTRLPLASKALAPLLWLLASESKDGSFNADIEELSFRLRMTEKEVSQGLPPLIKAGFFAENTPLASTVLATCEQVAPDSCSETEERREEAEAPATRSVKVLGSRLSEDWTLPFEWQEWAEKERPDLDIGTIAYGFRDFWIAKPGKDGRKADWQATWRNWVRNQRQQNGRPPAAPPAWAGAR
jgi:hypothetical protein